MMKSFVREMVSAASRRAGTAIGSFVSGASTVADAAQVEAAVILLCGVAFDLVLSHLEKRAR